MRDKESMVKLYYQYDAVFGFHNSIIVLYRAGKKTYLNVQQLP